MQVSKKKLFQFKSIKNILNIKKANFSQGWSTNPDFQNCIPRHVLNNKTGPNGWSIYNKNSTKIRPRVDHAVNNPNKDFPSVASKIAFLKGQSKV